MIDEAKKKALIEHIKQRQSTNEGEILISPELYFDGYDHERCTVCANVGPFSTSHFAARLNEVGQRSDVSAVFIRFYDYADALEFEDSWIGSDSVYVITSASIDDVRNWFADLHVSDIWKRTKSPVFLTFLFQTGPCPGSTWRVFSLSNWSTCLTSRQG